MRRTFPSFGLKNVIRLCALVLTVCILTSSQRSLAQSPAFLAGDTVRLNMCLDASDSLDITSALAVSVSAADTLSWSASGVSGGSIVYSGSLPVITAGASSSVTPPTWIFIRSGFGVTSRTFTVRVYDNAGREDFIVVKISNWGHPDNSGVLGGYHDIYNMQTVPFTCPSGGGTWLLASGIGGTISGSGVVTGTRLINPPVDDTVIYRKSNVCYTTDSIFAIRFYPLLSPGGPGTPGTPGTTPTLTAADTAFGIPGSSYTFTGSNFNSTPANNTVYFGGVKAAVTGGSSDTSLTVTIPAGASYDRITVKDDQSHLTGFQRYPFTPTFNTCAFIPSTTINMQAYDSIILRGGAAAGPSGVKPYSVELGDLDGDGKLDMVVCGTDLTGNLYVYRNISTAGTVNSSSFGSRIAVSVGFSGFPSLLMNCKIADIDGDGKPDIIGAGSSSGRVYIFRNTSTSGSISFATTFYVDISDASTGAGTLPIEINIADYNNDGRPDIGVACSGVDRGTMGSSTTAPGSVVVLKNTYNRRIAGASFINDSDFVANTIFVYDTITHHPVSLCSGDFDGDGDLDIAVSDHTGRSIKILKNTTSFGVRSISFDNTATPISTASGANGFPNQIRSADFNRDGHQDLVVAVSDSDFFSTNVYNFVKIYNNTTYGSGTITYAPVADLATGKAPCGVTVADLNGDHFVDMIVTNAGDGTVSIIKNTSSGGAITASSFGTHSDMAIARTVPGSSATVFASGIFAGPISVAIGDIDGNTVPDFAVVTREQNMVSIVRNAPVPVTNAIVASRDTVCVGASISLRSPRPDCSSAAGTWSVSNTNASVTVGGTGIADTAASLTGLTAGTVTVTYSVNSLSDIAFVTKTIVVADTANAGTITGPSAVCVGNTISLNNTATGGTWSSSASSIASVTTAPATSPATVLGVAGGSATISYSVAAPGCPTAVATHAVTVNPLPNAGFVTGPLTPCSGTAITYTDSAGVSGGSWSTSSTSVATIDAVTGVLNSASSSSGTLTITYTSSTVSCGTLTATRTITVVNSTAPAITGSTTVCANDSTLLSNTLAGGTWSTSNASIASINPSTGMVYGVLSTGGTVTISYAATCGATASRSETVNPLPLAGAISGPTHVCVGATTATGLVSTPTGGTWTSSNPSIAAINSTTGFITGVAPGTVTMKYHLTNSCGTDSVQTYPDTVFANPVAGTITSSTRTICQGSSIKMFNTTYSPAGTWSSLATGIASISTSNADSADVLGVAVGVTTIVYTSTNVCGSVTDTQAVNVISSPTSTTLTGDSVCVGATTTYTAGTPGGTWTIGPSTGIANVVSATSTTATVTGVGQGSATISYTLTNSCGSPVVSTRALRVDPIADAGTVSGFDTVCPGGTTVYSVTGDNSPGTWSSASSSIAAVGSTTGVVTGVSLTGGTTNISYTVTSIHGCGTDFAIRPVFVRANATPGTVSGPSALCIGDFGTYSASGTAGGRWRLSFGAPGTIDSLTGAYAAPGSGGSPFGVVFSVIYTASNACGPVDSSKNVTLTAPPSVTNISVANPSICVGATRTETSSIQVGSGSGTSIVWSSSDTSVFKVVSFTTSASSSATILGRSAGTATLTVTATNSCGTTTKTTTVTVNPAPNAGTINDIVNACVGTNSIYYITGGTDSVGGIWTIISGGAAINATYSDTMITDNLVAGRAIVEYKVTSLLGCGVSTVRDTFNIVNLPSAGTDDATLHVLCPGNTLVLAASATSQGTMWGSSNPLVAVTSASGSNIDTITAVGPGTATIYNIDSNYCGMDSSTFNVRVDPPAPNPGVIVGVDSICVGVPFTLKNTTADISAGPGVWSSVFPSIAAISGATDTSVVGNGISGGVDTIKYTVTNSCGSSVARKAVTVNNFPHLNNASLTGIVCDSTVFNFAPTADSSGSTFTWIRPTATNISNPADSFGVGGFSEYLDNTSNVNAIVVYHYATAKHGCVTNQDFTLTVKPTPYLTSPTTASVCSGSELFYNDSFNVVGTSSSTWTRPNSGAGFLHLTGTDADGAGINDIRETLTSDTLKPVTVVYTYNFNANGCTNSAKVTVTVNPTPSHGQMAIMHKPKTNDICVGTMYMNFGSASNPVGTGVNYSWSASNAVVWATGNTRQFCLVNFTKPGDAYVYLLATLPGYTCAAKDSVYYHVGETVAAQPSVIYFNGDFVCTSNIEESYQWGYDNHYTLDSETFAYQTNQNYTNLAPDFEGKWYWVITTRNGCEQKTYYRIPTAVKNITGIVGEVKLFPNPAAQYVNVEFLNTSGGSFKVEVMNMLGQQVSSHNVVGDKTTIDVADLAAGVYFVDCYRDGVKFATEKFVKN